jgi:hypothetical protein
VAGKPRGDQSEHPRDCAGQEEAGGQAKDRWRIGKLGKQRRCVRGEADEACLSKRCLAADTGEQYQAERDKGAQADIAEQRDVEDGQRGGHKYDDGKCHENCEPDSPSACEFGP